MPVTVGDVYRRIDEIAPFSLQEDWDNAGLLIGSAEREVDTLLCALDLTLPVLEEARRRGAQLIVTHHPILFRGRKDLREDDGEGRLLCGMVRSGLSLIAVHTNFDNACPGVNDALAARLGLKDVQPLENGMRLGVIDETTLGELCDFVGERLGGPVRCYGEAGRRVSRIALLGGAGEDFAMQALAAGAQVYLTGEMAYHKGLDAHAAGLCVLEAGHAATELPAISTLAEGLQIGPNGVKWNLKVLQSEAEQFR